MDTARPAAPISTTALSAIGILRQAITRDLVDGDTGAAMWLIVAVGALLVAVAAVLLGYVIRLAILAVLFVAGPLVLACYALPGAERAAAWWWRALAAVLVGQVGQALCLAIALRIFFSAGGIPDPASPINDPSMFVFAALGVIWLMGWLPFWMLRQGKPGGGNGLLGWFIASKTLGALGGRASNDPRGWPFRPSL
ncbi:hypothetical protein GCM10023321_14300 [Pseudonocardia eucalypti]|uniref:Uncharacterized protein n=1 Tax=Pseudonocardia eucalypti TaxID=648755 RepID=A0ABP9PRN6_9PSEU|nr:hypothetical protein [Pseudonocardia eucalypti]